MNLWHIAHTPTGSHVRQLNPVSLREDALARTKGDPELSYSDAVSEILSERAAAHRAELGFPVNGRWVQREGWDSQISDGEPHPSLLERATVTREE
jgi:hypothetical protein